MGALVAIMAGYAVFWIALMALIIWCYWKIFSKAGFNGALSLLFLVPCANLVILIWFAFSEWPIERQGRANMGPPPPSG
ncbi:MAG: hypothetical protein HYR64_05130 [Fimbriimonas ginsengisoli]|uniref:Uncharacterized protein n=1 Tax=Fimbriimonas ginsengisoli TaxID=1005039 RepID=A0A931LV77_FIMGI|nr:hypothetical protein [Fimbriimonas ginsengisoli]